MARLDTALFDEALFDVESSDDAVPVDTSDFKIDSYALQDLTVTLSRLTYSAPVYEAITRGFPRADGAYLEAGQFRRTSLMLKGSLRKDTQALLEAEMDLMRQAFAQGTVFKGTWAGEARYWTVYPASIDKLFAGRDGHHITWCPWEIELVCLHPYGRSAGRDSYSGIPATTTTTYQIDNGGTAPSQSIIDLIVATPGTLSKFSWQNQTTGETITIDNGGAYSAGDTLSINTETGSVMKNGTAIDYTGILPRMASGSNTCIFTPITGSGFVVTVSERHYKRYY